MLRTRIISAVAAIPFLLGILYLGGVYWQAFFVLLGLIALYEYFAMMKNKELKPLIVPACYIMLLLLFRMQLDKYLPLFFLIGLLMMVMIVVISYPKRGFIDFVFSLSGAIYIGFLLSYAMAMSNFHSSFLYMVFVLLLTWSSDVGGYFFGRLWGRNKLIPQLSPNKTREGAVGGVVLPIVVAILMINIVKIPNFNLVYTLLLGTIAGIVAQFGDLFVSGIKRYFSVKDSGKIIPGHGGVLDRFDSFMLLTPVVYYFFVFIVGKP